MEFKSYYNRYYAQDQQAKDFQEKVSKRIIPLIDAEFDKGYSPAEIEQIVHDIVAGQLAYRKVKYAVDLRKSERKEIPF